MNLNLPILQMADALARHSGERQSVIARNVAHADTPGYVARDLPDFTDRLALSSASIPLRVTRSAHFEGRDALAAGMVEARSGDSPNGNSVSLETEMVHAAETRLQHDLALGIYGKTISMMRAALGRK